MSSLATFSVGLYAVRHLPDQAMAMYALVLNGYVIGQLLVRTLVFTPLELSASLDQQVHVMPLKAVVRRARWGLIAGASIAGLSGLSVIGSVGAHGFFMMALTGALATVANPVQVHIRSMMHVVGRHERAGVTSSIAATVTLVTLLVAHFLPRSEIDFAIPFGALAAGMTVSTVTWRGMSAKLPAKAPPQLIPMRGRVLYVVPAISQQVGYYLQTNLIIASLGVGAAGTLEASRVAASPVFVLAAGLGPLFLPPVLRQLSNVRRGTSMRKLRRAMSVVFGAGMLYATVTHVVGTSVLSSIFGRHVDSLLTFWRATGNAVEGSAVILQGMYVSLRRERAAALISLVAAASVPLFTILFIRVLGVYIVPATQIFSALFQMALGIRVVQGGVVTYLQHKAAAKR